MKRILSIFLSLVLTAALLCPAAAAASETDGNDTDWLYITLDPGHGGNGAGKVDSGAVSSAYGYHEADLVLKIGLYLKQELETYRHVHVDMTRSDSYGTYYTAPLSEVERRVIFASEKHSDLLVSLHLNSAGSSQSVHGGLILASNGNYDPDCAKVIDAVGTNILAQLSRLGIDTSRGLVKEGSHDGTLYPNGKLADYYGIVRYGQLRHIPSMIVEHCFISSNSDCEQFLSSDAKLQAIAQADARGIAAYYGLQKKDPGEVDVEPTFYDCRHHWAKTSIEAAADAGWVNGVSAGEFQPDGTLTRAAFVTMLGRMAGVKDTDYTTSVFRDVPDGVWYTSFVAWATENGIVDGYGDGIFLPQNNITRQEMAKIMAKYLNWKGLDTTPSSEISSYPINDLNTIGGWALEPVCFCYEQGLLNGRGSNFAPQANATRAEACVVLCRLQKYVDAHSAQPAAAEPAALAG